MDQQQELQQNLAYADVLIERLRELYLARRPMPTDKAEPMNMTRFYNLYRHVLAEGYGEAAPAQ
jgi:hypothetical protein